MCNIGFLGKLIRKQNTYLYVRSDLYNVRNLFRPPAMGKQKAESIEKFEHILKIKTFNARTFLGKANTHINANTNKSMICVAIAMFYLMFGLYLKSTYARREVN